VQLIWLEFTKTTFVAGLPQNRTVAPERKSEPNGAPSEPLTLLLPIWKGAHLALTKH